jgi:hypothetical protein
MVTPNADCVLFCTWIQDSGFYRFSTARVALIALVKDAGQNVTEITNQQYNDFIRVTNTVYSGYLQYMAYKL